MTFAAELVGETKITGMKGLSVPAKRDGKQASYAVSMAAGVVGRRVCA